MLSFYVEEKVMGIYQQPTDKQRKEMKKEKLFNWKVKLQLVFVVLMLLLLNAIAPKPFAKHEQVECINVEQK
jgi:hypothetical protein